jgi:hypothetical protein
VDGASCEGKIQRRIAVRATLFAAIHGRATGRAMPDQPAIHDAAFGVPIISHALF